MALGRMALGGMDGMKSKGNERKGDPCFVGFHPMVQTRWIVVGWDR